MNDDDMIRALLTSAGMLMEDASARLIFEDGDVDGRVTELRQTARDLTVIADAAEAIQRRRGAAR